VLMPDELLRRCAPCELRLMLAHELAHLRRRDLWWNGLPLLCEVLFFFHPLVWLARREWRFSQELAADESVLLTLESSPATYGQMLLRVCETISTSVREPSPLLSVSVVESAQTIKQRLIAMKYFTRLSKGRLTAIGATVALLGILALVPWRLVAQAPRAEAASDPFAVAPIAGNPASISDLNADRETPRTTIPADPLRVPTSEERSDASSRRGFEETKENYRAALARYEEFAARYTESHPQFQDAKRRLEVALKSYEEALKLFVKNVEAVRQADASVRRKRLEVLFPGTNNPSPSCIFVIQLQHADPTRVLDLVRPALDSSVQVFADERTRSLIVVAPNNALAEISVDRIKQVDQSDLPTKQVNFDQSLENSPEVLDARMKVAKLELRIAEDKHRAVKESVKDPSHPTPAQSVRLNEAELAVAKAKLEVIRVSAQIEYVAMAHREKKTIAKARAVEGNSSAGPLETVRGRINEDIFKTFLQQPEFRDIRALQVEMIPEGLLINFLDRPNQPIFKTDSAEFTEFGAWVLNTVAWEIARYPTTIIEVEGHTESGFKGPRQDYGAWESSIDRANASRRRLLDNGIKESQIAKLSGSGATKPLKASKPDDRDNRRVSLLLRAAPPRTN
jgi:flagellar motor protein MotB